MSIATGREAIVQAKRERVTHAGDVRQGGFRASPLEGAGFETSP